MRLFSTFLLFCSLILGACTTGKIGVVDLNQIMSQSTQAKNAQQEVIEVQKIYQYNLGVIEKKLARYEDKAKAQNYLKQAAAQLQQQLQASHAGINQALAEKLSEVIEEQTKDYSIVMNKNAVWISGKDEVDITETIMKEFDNATINYPPRPLRVDNPTLPK